MAYNDFRNILEKDDIIIKYLEYLIQFSSRLSICIVRRINNTYKLFTAEPFALENKITIIIF